MPLYEYRCSQCGERFEVLQNMGDPPLAVHEGCGGELTKLLSSPAFQFKGTGWYVTDYARAGKGSGKGAEKGGDSGQDHGGATSESGKQGKAGESKSDSASSGAQKSGSETSSSASGTAGTKSGGD